MGVGCYLVEVVCFDQLWVVSIIITTIVVTASMEVVTVQVVITCFTIIIVIIEPWFTMVFTIINKSSLYHLFACSSIKFTYLCP